ncbi:hypothetical protein GRI58_08680 [Porphyrobacter algicida]|uniref:DUF883 family protein n=1 Tax=Qipengyuania algicida TaxID=1836209 RepID=A0A845AK20_9SPHN|nr:hypothetical protein [Qipengyuania algicida]MXP28896.1 hypothetical protein [Qipengyuania algicida]
MAEKTETPKPKKRTASTRKSAASNTRPKASKVKETTAMTDTITPPAPVTDHKAEAKSRFNAALEEAKAGAAALKAEAGDRASAYRSQARGKSKDLSKDAKAYADEAKVRGKELATQGKGKLSEGLTALGQTVAENAHVVDERLGAKYGDYARSASRSLKETATKLDGKSVEELGEDAREMVRKSPATAVGIAAVVGFMLSRLFTRSRR